MRVIAAGNHGKWELIAGNDVVVVVVIHVGYLFMRAVIGLLFPFQV
jgi:hypothetical protein